MGVKAPTGCPPEGAHAPPVTAGSKTALVAFLSGAQLAGAAVVSWTEPPHTAPEYPFAIAPAHDAPSGLPHVHAEHARVSLPPS